MPVVKCSVGSCSRRLQPIHKVDPRDRDTWLYPDCEACGLPACDEHSSVVDNRVICDRCRREAEGREPPPLIDLGVIRRGGG